MTKHHLVFVYGTLRQGCCNHFLLEGARCVGAGKTAGQYAMYVASVPFVVKDAAVCQIVGEVYEVDEKTLRNLDLLEGEPHMYAREQVEIELDNGRHVCAWLYFYPKNGGD